jgi:hypothetical protein
MSAGLEEIAQAVAVAVEEKDLRDRIYAKCMEKFDGETNVLWQQLEADANLKSKGGWSKKVDSELGKGRKNVVVKGIGNVDAAVKKFEKAFNAPLHLFWAFPANWDKKTTPLVAFVPMDMDPDERQSIPAFDSKGNRIELDRKDPSAAKQRPVIVITFNERSLADGKAKPGLMVPNAQGKIVLNEDGTANSKSSKSGAKLTASQKIVVNWVEVPSAIIDEPWFDGTTEWIYTSEITGWQYEPDPNIPGNIIWSVETDGYATYTLGWYQSRYSPGTNIELSSFSKEIR